MPCEYGPSATGALFVWMASFAMIALLRAKPDRIYHARHQTSVLDFEARGDPRIDAAVQRAHALESGRAQLLGDLHRGCFVRARAVHDDLVLLRHTVEPSGDVLDVDGPSAGNAPARLLGKCRAYV